MKTLAPYGVAVTVLLALTAAINLAAPSLNAANGGPTVTVANTPLPTQVVNLPAVQTVNGTVSVANLPTAQTVSGTVAISNPVLPVRNLDEPGRNPYQETMFKTCSGQGDCGFNYGTVPAGKRLVVTGIAGYVDVANGTYPNCFLQSIYGGTQYVSQPVPFVKSTAGANNTRFVVNQDIHGYFGAQEYPMFACTLFSTSDNFSGGLQISVTGYYVDVQ